MLLSRTARYFRVFQHIAEFYNYLGQLIVTAGVHRRLASELSPRGLTFRHWPGVSLYTSSCEFAETCVFGKQSPGIMRCGQPLLLLSMKNKSRSWQPLLRTYGRCFAEFLNEGSPDHLGTLTPVHLCWFAVRAASKTSV